MTFENLTADQVVAIGQIFIALFTMLGVLVSLFMSIKALNEVKLDRRLNKAPYLAFNTGGYRYPIQFTAIKTDDGQSKEQIQLPTPEGKVVVQYGKLYNYGLGPAIHAKITWIPETIWLGEEKFKVDKEKINESKYKKSSNTIPASPGHILPKEYGKFFRIPSFITQDYDKKISHVEGMLEITCLDVFKNKYETHQKFHIFTHYKDENPTIHFTFSDIIME